MTVRWHEGAIILVESFRILDALLNSGGNDSLVLVNQSDNGVLVNLSADPLYPPPDLAVPMPAERLLTQGE